MVRRCWFCYGGHWSELKSLKSFWCCRTEECIEDWISHPDYSRTWGNYLWVNLAWVGALHRGLRLERERVGQQFWFDQL